jgi:hypothetical protein
MDPVRDPPWEGCEDSGDSDGPMSAVGVSGPRPELALLWQGRWGGQGPGTQGAAPGGAEGVDRARRSRAGAPAEWPWRLRSRYGTIRRGVLKKPSLSTRLPRPGSPPRKGTSGAVRWVERIGRSGVGAPDRLWPASWETEAKPRVKGCGGHPVGAVAATATLR